MDRDIGYALGIASHIHIYLHIACRITHSYRMHSLSIDPMSMHPMSMHRPMCMHLCNLAVLVSQAHACMQSWRACVTAREAAQESERQEQECERQERQRKRRVYAFVMDEDMR